MSLIPGVPNMSPSPVSPTIKPGASSKTSVGKPQGISAIAHSVGKPGNTQHLGNITSMSPHATPRSSLGGGDPLAHMMNHYGKGGIPGVPGMPGGSNIDPTKHAGMSMIRGGSGTMRSHIREGGLGPGPESTPGPSDTDYSMQSEDSE